MSQLEHEASPYATCLALGLADYCLWSGHNTCVAPPNPPTTRMLALPFVPPYLRTTDCVAQRSRPSDRLPCTPTPLPSVHSACPLCCTWDSLPAPLTSCRFQASKPAGCFWPGAAGGLLPVGRHLPLCAQRLRVLAPPHQVGTCGRLSGSCHCTCDSHFGVPCLAFYALGCLAAVWHVAEGLAWVPCFLYMGSLAGTGPVPVARAMVQLLFRPQ